MEVKFLVHYSGAETGNKAVIPGDLVEVEQIDVKALVESGMIEDPYREIAPEVVETPHKAAGKGKKKVVEEEEVAPEVVETPE